MINFAEKKNLLLTNNRQCHTLDNMQILWDSDKNNKLIADRGLSFDAFASLILEKKYYAILKNPSRDGQKIFVIPYEGYTYVVPFVIDNDQNIVLKTIFPSRRYHKIYGGKK